jgi:prephenate dehydrogenase
MARTLGIVGIGAFGEFMLKHVAPYFDIRIYDSHRDLSGIAARYNVEALPLAEVAKSDVVVLAVPVQRLAEVVAQVAPDLRPGTLLIDVCSVKVRPTAALLKHAPAGVDIVSTHPLFGPNSGRNGIRDLRISVCNVRGRRLAEVCYFLRRELGLRTIVTTAEQHDRELAYVQGLTHLIAKAIVGMGLPEHMRQTTPTFMHLMDMVNVIRDDSDDLFRAIEAENPYAKAVKAEFLEQLQAIVRSIGAAEDDSQAAGE